VSQRVVEKSDVPVIGCGAGPACHGSVVVTHDAIGLSAHRPPRFVPKVGDAASVLKEMFAKYVNNLESGAYPAPEHQYEMPADERAKFAAGK
jgi:3-methyl-2-oxobutanoate hydroxymethyltransferase